MVQQLVNISISLKPVWHSDPPKIRVGVPGDIRTLYLNNPTTFNFEYHSKNNSDLIIEFLNKIDADTILDKNLDKAIIIEDISFFGISDPKFIWAGIYTPIYPEHLTNQPKTLTNVTYLGFNGQWKLDFTVPVFTWIHKIQGLGWIYD